MTWSRLGRTRPFFPPGSAFSLQYLCCHCLEPAGLSCTDIPDKSVILEHTALLGGGADEGSDRRCFQWNPWGTNHRSCVPSDHLFRDVAEICGEHRLGLPCSFLKSSLWESVTVHLWATEHPPRHVMGVGVHFRGSAPSLHTFSSQLWFCPTHNLWVCPVCRWNEALAHL